MGLRPLGALVAVLLSANSGFTATLPVAANQNLLAVANIAGAPIVVGDRSGGWSFTGPSSYSGRSSYSGSSSYKGSSGYTGPSSYSGPSTYNPPANQWSTRSAPAAPGLNSHTLSNQVGSPNAGVASPSSTGRVNFLQPSAHPAGGGTSYTFAPTSSGTVQVFQSGQRISTTTPQNAAATYGYQIPAVAVAPESVGVVPAPSSGRFNFTPVQAGSSSSDSAKTGTSARIQQETSTSLTFPAKQQPSSIVFPPNGSSGIAGTTPEIITNNNSASSPLATLFQGAKNVYQTYNSSTAVQAYKSNPQIQASSLVTHGAACATGVVEVVGSEGAALLPAGASTAVQCVEAGAAGYNLVNSVRQK